MPGFLAIIAKEGISIPLELEYVGLGPVVKGRMGWPNGYVQRFVNPKCERDKVFAEDDALLVALEGVVLNFPDLQTRYGGTGYFDTVKKMYKCKGSRFFDEFRGSCSGVVYDKTARRWVIFTDPAGVKPVYIYHEDGLFVAASELNVVAQVLRSAGRNYHLSELAAYFILTYGFMLEEHTLIKEVKRLMPRCSILVEDGQVRMENGEKFDNSLITKESKTEIIENLDTLFTRAVRLEYEKDREYGYRHIATLSGGLDSRMTVMTAYEIGYLDQMTITFSQNDYYDDKISKAISSDLRIEHLFYPLDNGTYLRNVRRAVRANGGMVLYSGSAHLLSCIEKINFSSFGVMHTGMIGDAILGGTFLTGPRPVKPKLEMGAYSKTLLDRIRPDVEKILEHYETEETYLLYNRAFNGANNGLWTINQYTECASPFLYPDFVDYCFSIPPELRYNHKIYIEWILHKHPRAAQYVWENSKMKPSTNTVLPFLILVWRKGCSIVFGPRRFGSMNPFQYWYLNNELLRNYIEEYYLQNRHRLEGYSELKKQCETLFSSGTLLEKTQVMTLLEAMRVHFPQ
jgi:asparagine synthase (glutamine-hydrolysing)